MFLEVTQGRMLPHGAIFCLPEYTPSIGSTLPPPKAVVPDGANFTSRGHWAVSRDVFDRHLEGQVEDHMASSG